MKKQSLVRLFFVCLSMVFTTTYAQDLDSNFTDTSNWTINATSSSDPNNAFDGDLSTRWTTSQTQRQGQFFEIDFNTVKSFDNIILDSALNPNDYPRSYSVLTSLDGVEWTSVAEGTPSETEQLEISFDQQNARFLRIEQNGQVARFWWSIHELTLSLESAVSLSNLALGQSTEQSSTSFSGDASRAVDGSTNGRYFRGSVTHTEINETNPWWQVDLSAQSVVPSIVLYNRSDNCCTFRLNDVYVFVSPTPFGDRSLAELLADQTIESSFHSGEVGSSLEVGFNSAEGRYVRVQLANTGTLSLAEVQVNGWSDEDEASEFVSTLDDAVETNVEAADFLLHATFGPTEDSIEELRELGYSQWFKNQLSSPIDGYLDATIAQEEIGGSNRLSERYSLNTWFEKAVTGDDQLRQVATYALSQIFATSTLTNLTIRKATMHAVFKDILQDNAFGNYRDILEEVTYSTQMGNWLTYVGNEKADPDTGSMPDENYAREIMQLFTVGVIQLNQDGTSVLANNEEVELYDGDDIRELAKVFTGLYWPNRSFGGRISQQSEHDTDLPPMVMHNDYHSGGEKTVLGTTIPEYTDGGRTISAALDVLFYHDNIAPFVSKILIQRLVTSNPSPSYVERVANAFTSGTYQLPDGSSVGTEQRGDLVPVWAAILFAPEATGDYRFENTDEANQFGKLRDPIERFVHWMRVSDVRGFEVESIARFGDVNILPFRAPSVFNFYRPGYVASNTSTGDEGLLAPELQIFNGPNIIGFLNAMRTFIPTSSENTEYFYPAYTTEIALASDAEALVEHMNLVYTANKMTDQTQTDMIESIEDISITGTTAERNEALAQRVHVATLLTMASVEFNVRR